MIGRVLIGAGIGVFCTGVALKEGLGEALLTLGLILCLWGALEVIDSSVSPS